MKHPEPTRKILLEYMLSHSSEIFKRKIELQYPNIDCLQIQVLTNHMEQFCCSRKKDEILLLFPFILGNIRFTNPKLKLNDMVKTLWERGFSNAVESKEQLEQMYKVWLSFEKEVLSLEIENQQLLETSQVKNHNIEHK